MKSVSFSDLNLSLESSEQDNLITMESNHDNGKKTSLKSQYNGYSKSMNYDNEDSDSSTNKYKFSSNGFENNKALSNSSGYSQQNHKSNMPNRTLTHYKSSEDILKRFATKYTPTVYSNTTKNQLENHDKIQPKESIENNDNEPCESQTTEVHHYYDKEQFIQDLKQQIEMKDGIITRLQDEKIELQTKYDKISDQSEILENRIKYLEHMLSAFTTDNNSNDKSISKEGVGKIKIADDKDTEKGYRSESGLSRSNSPSKFDTSYNKSYNKYSSEPENKTEFPSSYFSKGSNLDLNFRPNSADSLFVQNTNTSPLYSTLDVSQYSKYNGNKPYDSDSDDRFQSREDSRQNTASPSSFSHWQRRKLDRERNSNMSDFKNRLDQFTQYANKTAERNSLKSTSLTSFKDYRDYRHNKEEPCSRFNTQNKYHTSYTNNIESRPPLNPYHRSKKLGGVTSSNNLRQSADGAAQYTSSYYEQASQDDENLKDRVKRILEKHNYTDQYDSHNKSHSPHKHWNDSKYPYSDYNSHNSYGNSNSSNNVPRLDLTTADQESSVLDAETNNLLAKYLNYPEYQSVF